MKSAAAGNRSKARRRNGRIANPSTSFAEAEDLSREWHGRDVEVVEEHTEVEEYDKNLANLADLEELTIIWNDGNEEKVTPIDFVGCGIAMAGKGNHIQFIGGDQELNLEGLVEEIPELSQQVDVSGKPIIDIGEVYSIVYFTDKHHLAEPKKPLSREHPFAEKSGKRPRLQYDRRNTKISLVGGSYRITPLGIDG